MASWKVEICLKKKNPPRAQIFHYFRIDSRNKNDCPKIAKFCRRFHFSLQQKDLTMNWYMQSFCYLK